MRAAQTDITLTPGITSIELLTNTHNNVFVVQDIHSSRSPFKTIMCAALQKASQACCSVRIMTSRSKTGVPFKEDHKDNETWFIDHNYIKRCLVNGGTACYACLQFVCPAVVGGTKPKPHFDHRSRAHVGWYSSLWLSSLCCTSVCSMNEAYEASQMAVYYA